MRICVLSPAIAPGDPPEPTTTPQWVAPDAHEWTLRTIHKATAAQQVREYAAEGWEVFFNLCDGAIDEPLRPGVEVVRELERLGVAFTGTDSEHFEPTRAEMKRACEVAGISTPAYRFVDSAAQVGAVLEGLRFPLIVKPPAGYSSIGVTRESLCRTEAELARQIEHTVRAYQGALVEEYIVGREFVVLVAEPGEGEHRPRVWSPLEFHFPPGEEFKHFDLKWSGTYEVPPLGAMTTSHVEDGPLARALMEQTADFFSALGCTGYARSDVRMDAEGRLYALELNPNCGMFYPPGGFMGGADVILHRIPGGHRAFLDHLLRAALARRDRNAARTRGA